MAPALSRRRVIRSVPVLHYLLAWPGSAWLPFPPSMCLCQARLCKVTLPVCCSSACCVTCLWIQNGCALSLACCVAAFGHRTELMRVVLHGFGYRTGTHLQPVLRAASFHLWGRSGGCLSGSCCCCCSPPVPLFGAPLAFGRNGQFPILEELVISLRLIGVSVRVTGVVSLCMLGSIPLLHAQVEV